MNNNPTYSWWKKTCTTGYGKHPIIYRFLYIPGGAGFLPSTAHFTAQGIFLTTHFEPSAFVACDIDHKPWFRVPLRNWLVVSTHLKNISQIGNLPQLGVKIKNIWNHHLGKLSRKDIIHGLFWNWQGMTGNKCRSNTVFLRRYRWMSTRVSMEYLVTT